MIPPIDVDDEAYASAATVFGGQVGPHLMTAAEVLNGYLGATAEMAGGDSSGLKFAHAYDSGAQAVAKAINHAVAGSYGMARLLQQTGLNHASAEAASGRLHDVTDNRSYVACGGADVAAPSAAGGPDGGEPHGWSLIRSHIDGFLWPNGHQDKLRSAAHAWNGVASAFDEAAGTVGDAESAILQQQSSEVADACTVCRSTASNFRAIAHGSRQLASACDSYAGHLDSAHSSIKTTLIALLAAVGTTEVVGGIISIFTVGTAEVPTQAGAAGEITVAAGEVVDTLTTLGTEAAAVATTSGEAVDTVDVATSELSALADADTVTAESATSPALPEGEQGALQGLEDAKGPGEWGAPNESMSTRAAQYQGQISGRAGETYTVNGVKFDGFTDGVLQDAKGPGYAKFVDADGDFKPWYSGADKLIGQAQRQLSAANGTPITWSIAEPRALEAIENLFAENGITGIRLVYVPPTG